MAGLNLQPYQAQILRLLQGGFKFGQMSVISAGRQTGKSYLNQLYNNNLCKEILMPTEPQPKYKFSRAKWYSVRLGDTLWRLSDEYNEIIAWCTEQFGAHPNKPDAWSRWHVSVGHINFRDEQDYILYQLKWS